MNSKVRKSLKSLHYDLGKAIDLISGIRSDIEDIKYEEEDKFENLPDGLKYARVGEDIESGIDSLDEILTQLEYAYDNLEDASNQIEELTE
jgi:hypothetical protein